MLSTATRSRWNLPLLLSVAAAVTLSSTEAFGPSHTAFFEGRQQAGSSKHQQKHNTRHSHTRIAYLTSVTNRSNTKMGVSNRKVLDEIGKVLNKLEEVKTGLEEVKTSLEEVKTSLEEVKTSLEEVKTSLIEVKTSLKEVKTSYTKMGDDLKEVNTSTAKMGDDLKEVKTSNTKMVDELTKMGDELKEVSTKLDRIDNRTALMVEARCREKMGFHRKEVKGVSDALSLLFIGAKGAEYEIANTRLVDALYRDCTRDLFAKITGKEWTDEKEALASLKDWRRDANKEKNSNGGDTDDDKGYSAHTETVVVENFIKILAPFDVANVDKMKAHDAAKKILRHDETGLALSLIIASMDDKQDDKGGCWDWKVLEFDGVFHSDYHPNNIKLLEVKCGPSLQKAKKQLDVRTRFIDAVATLAEYKGVKVKIVKYAYVDGADGEMIDESVDDYNHISALKLIIMKIEL
jgi:archaellum component FlaC